MFQQEKHFINKRLQKLKRVNLKCMLSVNNVNKTNGNTYNSQSFQFQVGFFLLTEIVIPIVAHGVGIFLQTII
jgi:hypothetical protein